MIYFIIADLCFTFACLSHIKKMAKQLDELKTMLTVINSNVADSIVPAIEEEFNK